MEYVQWEKNLLVIYCSWHSTSVWKVNSELRNRNNLLCFYWTPNSEFTFLLLAFSGNSLFAYWKLQDWLLTSTIRTLSLEPTSLAMSVYFCFSSGSRTAHQSASILVAPRLSSLGCFWRTRERWRLQNKRNAFIGLRARCSGDSSSSASPTSCSRPSAPRSCTYYQPKQKPDA